MNEHELQLALEERKGRASLAGQLAKCLGEMGAIPKSGYNSFHKYSYHTEGDITSAIRALLARHGVAVMWSKVESVRTEGKDARGKALTRVVFTGKLTLTCADTGAQMEVFGEGEGEDSGDKATYKANTGAYKYALMKCFMLSDCESDPERSTSTGERTNGGGGGDSKPSRAPSAPQKTTLPEKDHSKDPKWETQSKRFFALASEANVSDDENIAYREWFKGQLGAKSWTHIPTDKLQGLNDALQKLDLEERGARMRSKG